MNKRAHFLALLLTCGCSSAIVTEPDCAAVNSGKNYRFVVSEDVFEVSPAASAHFATDAAAALSCGARLTELGKLEVVHGSGWPSFFHFEEGDRVVSVNGEHDGPRMIDAIEAAASSAGSVAVVYQRGNLEFGYVELVDFVSFQ